MLYLRPEEDEKLLNAPTAPRDQVMLRLLLVTGVRVSELSNIHVEDVDFSSREILIQHGKGGKDRIVFIDHETLKMVKNYVGGRTEGPLLLSRKHHHQLSRRQIQHLVKEYARAAGLRNADLITPHKLRHTFAIRWIQKGGDIESLRRLLGHSNLQVTQVYLDFTIEHVRAEFDRLSKIPMTRRDPRRAAAMYIT